jgi:hypothetical protein
MGLPRLGRAGLEWPDMVWADQAMGFSGFIWAWLACAANGLGCAGHGLGCAGHGLHWTVHVLPWCGCVLAWAGDSHRQAIYWAAHGLGCLAHLLAMSCPSAGQT